MEKIDEYRLPIQLATYFQDSKKVSEFLNEKVLEDIEELYTMYKSLYLFDETEFSKYAIKCVERCKDIDGFYYYFKKVIDSSIELNSKGNMKSNSGIDIDYVDKIFKKVSNLFVKNLEEIKDGWGILNIKNTYTLLGKLELICELVEDEFYLDVLTMGKVIIERYEDKGNEDYMG
ncbi:hypothetical protein [Calidifontibacillus oryziterrae]|uniref:hypothetical protein n=1 Tax=Calidifontibacillus oryziterrae TaxID=1191699 RepID=UPI00030411B9|nr:hypothetical protein [Calidifontibacillus oryziterrae]